MAKIMEKILKRGKRRKYDLPKLKTNIHFTLKIIKKF